MPVRVDAAVETVVEHQRSLVIGAGLVKRRRDVLLHRKGVAVKGEFQDNPAVQVDVQFHPFIRRIELESYHSAASANERVGGKCSRDPVAAVDEVAVLVERGEVAGGGVCHLVRLAGDVLMRLQRRVRLAQRGLHRRREVACGNAAARLHVAPALVRRQIPRVVRERAHVPRPAAQVVVVAGGSHRRQRGRVRLARKRRAKRREYFLHRSKRPVRRVCLWPRRLRSVCCEYALIEPGSFVLLVIVE